MGCGLRWWRVFEESGQIGEEGLGARFLGGDDFAMAEEEGAWHLKAIAGEVAHAAAAKEGDEGGEPDGGAEEFEETALAEAEGAVELAEWVGHAIDAGALADVGGFAALLEHVDEDEAGAVLVGLLFQVFEVANDLAGEGAAEVAEEDDGEGLAG